MQAKPNQTLKVGLVFDDSLDSADGVAQHVKTLGAWLSGAGHDVVYLVGETKISSWAGGRVLSLSRNLSVTFNGNRLSMPVLSKKARLARVIHDEKFDILHVMTPYSPFMSQRLIKLAPSQTAVIGTFHIFPSGHLSRIGARLLRVVYGQSLRRFDTMLSVSRPAAEFCRQSLGMESTVVPNPIDLSAFRRAGVKKSGLHVVFLGRLVKRKGCEQLLRAFQKLLIKLPDARLTIAGDGHQRPKLEKLADKLGIGPRTRFLGRVSEADKPSLLSSADVACFPSLYGESFGIVLVEAMAAGSKAVLGGDNPGYRSVLGGRPKLLVDVRDTALFAGRLYELLSDSHLRDRLSDWQAAEVRQYDVNSVGPKVLAHYREAIARLAKNSHNEGHE